jgi:hypothetical protein
MMTTAAQRVVRSADGATAMVLSNDLAFSWVVPGPSGEPVVMATQERTGYLAGLAMRGAAGQVAVLADDLRRIEWYNFGGSSFSLAGATLLGGYEGVIGCRDGFYAWRRVTDLTRIERITSSGVVELWNELSLPDHVDIGCNSNHLLIAKAAAGGSVALDIYPLANVGAGALSTVNMPFSGGAPEWLRVLAGDDLAVVQAGGGGAGIVAWDISDPRKPEFAAADLGPVPAGLMQLQLTAADPGSWWLTGLYDDPDMGPRIVVKRIQ